MERMCLGKKLCTIKKMYRVKTTNSIKTHFEISVAIFESHTLQINYKISIFHAVDYLIFVVFALENAYLKNCALLIAL